MSYAELSLVVVVFNGIGALAHIPMGVLVDRIGAPTLLIAALIVQGITLITIALTANYGLLLAFMVVGGLANAVYHPADYAILSYTIDNKVLGRAFSIHTVAGFAGGAAAPIFVVGLTVLWDWQSAVASSGILGAATAAFVIFGRGALRRAPSEEAVEAPGTPGERPFKDVLGLLLSRPILLAFLFWLCIAVSYDGIAVFSVAALDQLFRVPLATATSGLTGFMVGASAGILLGGVLGDYTRHHTRIVVGGCTLSALLILLVGTVSLPVTLITAVLTAAGVCWGVIMPARDLIVRSLTPPNATGAVFGFVSTGFNVGGITAPFLFGWLLDQKMAQSIFLISSCFMVLTLLTALGVQLTTKPTRPLE